MAIRIYKGKFGWSILCKNNYNGVESKCYMPLQFRKGLIEPTDDSAEIEPTEFFMSAYKNNEKNIDLPKMVVMNYQLVGVPNKKEPEQNNMGNTNPSVNGTPIDTNDLDFY